MGRLQMYIVSLSFVERFLTIIAVDGDRKCMCCALMPVEGLLIDEPDAAIAAQAAEEQGLVGLEAFVRAEKSGVFEGALAARARDRGW